MDFSSVGILESILKIGKVILWVAVAGAITAIIQWIAGLNIDASNYILVAAVGLINAVLAGLLKWISTKK